jgi:hypothetical protein
VVAVDNAKHIEHVMHCGRAELYLFDDLRNRDNLFENGTDLLNAQINPLVMTSYPLGCDYFSDDVSVTRLGGAVLNRFFGNLWIQIPTLIKFVLQHGETNSLQDGDQAVAVRQWHQVIFGCGQSFTDKHVDGNSAPKSTYGFDDFQNIVDEREQLTIKQMLGDSVNNMQECEDYIEGVLLNNAQSFNHSAQEE